MTHTTLDAIAWTLIHFCWQAAAVAAVYRLLSFAMARRTSQARYLLALSALLVMLASSLVTFAWEIRSGSAASSFAATSAIAGFNQTIKELPGSLSQVSAQANPALTDLSLRAALPWIDVLWVLGVIVLSVRSLGGWWLIQRLRAASILEAPAAVQAGFSRIAAALGIHRPVLLRVSTAIAGPVTIGALRTLVLLPLAAATSLSPEELEVVLAHELAHVRRADFFWNLIQTLVETLFFFHPAVWWIGNRIRHERELCCDDLALKVCPNPVVYAHALFRLEEQRSRQMRLAMALDGHQSPQTLRMRIARILGEPVKWSAKRPARPFSLAAVCAALLVLMLPVPQVLASLNPKFLVLAPTPACPIPSPEIAAAAAHPSSIQPSAHLLAAAPNMVLQAVATANPAASADQSASAAPPAQNTAAADAQPRSNYIDRMKAAGYDVDLDKYVAMKIQGVTPEYAAAMAQIGFGKLSADDLIACKVHSITPEFIAGLKQKGFEVKSVQTALVYHIFQITPEFAADMKAAGFDNLDADKLVALRVQGVTPEYANQIAQQFPGATVDDVIKTRIFRIDADFIAQAKAHGFTGLSLNKLVELRISGILDDESVKK